MAMRHIDWKPILTEYQTGQYSISKLAEKHEVSKSTLSQKVKELDNSVTEQAKAVISSFDNSIEQLSNIATEHPNIANKIVDIVTDKHPQFKKAMVALSSKIFNRALVIADTANAQDLTHLSKAMQTTTDTLGVTQRHSTSQVNVNTQTNVQNNIPISIEWE